MLEYERLAQEYAERWGLTERQPDEDTTEIEAAYMSGFIQARTLMLDWVEVYMRCVPDNTLILMNIREQFRSLGPTAEKERTVLTSSSAEESSPVRKVFMFVLDITVKILPHFPSLNRGKLTGFSEAIGQNSHSDQ